MRRGRGQASILLWHLALVMGCGSGSRATKIDLCCCQAPSHLHFRSAELSSQGRGQLPQLTGGRALPESGDGDPWVPAVPGSQKPPVACSQHRPKPGLLQAPELPILLPGDVAEALKGSAVYFGPAAPPAGRAGELALDSQGGRKLLSPKGWEALLSAPGGTAGK